MGKPGRETSQKRPPLMTRFSVSLEEGLLKKFDERTAAAGYRNRSAALRYVIRRYLSAAAQRQPGPGQLCATVTLVMRRAPEHLADLAALKAALRPLVRGTQQHFPGGDYFLDITLLQGAPDELQTAQDRLQSLKGILSCQTVLSSLEPPCHRG